MIEHIKEQIGSNNTPSTIFLWNWQHPCTSSARGGNWLLFCELMIKAKELQKTTKLPVVSLLEDLFVPDFSN